MGRHDEKTRGRLRHDGAVVGRAIWGGVELGDETGTADREGRAVSLPQEMYSSGSYLDKNPTWDSEDSAWKAARVRDVLDAADLSPSSICDVGCGAGGVIAAMRGYYPQAELFGFEIAPAAAGFWERHAAADVSFRVADFLEESDRYDVVMLLDVVEHLVDPHAFLSRVRDRAEHVVIHFPLDLSAQTVLREQPLLDQRRSVGHIHYFTRRLALELMRECGYRVHHAAYTGAAFTVPRKSFRTVLAAMPRRIAYLINKDLGVRLLGGETLIVLASPS